MKKVVVEGFELEISSPLNNTIGSFTVISQPNNKFSVNDKKCFFGKINISLNEIVDKSTGNTQTEPLDVIISGTSEKLFYGVNKAVLEGDSVNAVVTGVSPSGVTVFWPITIKIKSANQDKLYSN